MKNNVSVPQTILQGNTTWSDLSNRIKKAQPSAIFILTDTHTQQHCLPVFLKNCTLNSTPTILCIEAGEEHKTLETCIYLWHTLLTAQADRNSLLINLGGGMITDIGGFVAATYKRGINCIQIPTSLLAMVDAAIGGKNGVNFNHAKNQIGSIVSPYSIAILPEFLNTLPQREFVSGTAEMFKHGLIASHTYWEILKQTPLTYTEDFSELILESIQIKTQIVEQDKHEKNLRKTLNYGHTLGHAIETFTLESKSTQTLLHGEAVAIGMILATHISVNLLGFSKQDMEEITGVLLKKFPKINFSKPEIITILAHTKSDKKNRNGKVLFVLLEKIGKCKLDVKVPDDVIFDAFKFYNTI